jgi:hypothetical protein
VKIQEKHIECTMFVYNPISFKKCLIIKKWINVSMVNDIVVAIAAPTIPYLGINAIFNIILNIAENKASLYDT